MFLLVTNFCQFKGAKHYEKKDWSNLKYILSVFYNKI